MYPTRSRRPLAIAAAFFSVALPSNALTASASTIDLPTTTEKWETARTARTVFVLNIEVSDTGPIDVETVRSVLRPFEGRELSAIDIRAARDAVTALYNERGFVNSGATLPAQDYSDGTIYLSIVIGSLTKIEVSETSQLKGLREGYIRNRLVSTNAPLNSDELQEKFQLLVADPTIRQLNGNLVPGDGLGQATLQLDADILPRLSLSAVSASDRSPALGGVRGGIGLTLRNTLGIADQLTVDLSGFEGGYDLIGQYTIPVGSRGSSLYIRGNLADSDVVEEPLTDLNIISESESVAAGGELIVFRRPGRSLSLTGEYEARRTQTALLGMPFSFSPGSLDGETEFSALRFGQSFVFQNDRRVFAAESRFSMGLSSSTVSTVPNGPSEKFSSWLGRLRYAQRLGDHNHQVIARLDAQLTDGTLFSAERMYFGGAGTVRGFRTNEVLTDTGVVGSVEYERHFPKIVARAGSLLTEVSASLFVDAGYGENAMLPDPTVNELASIGVSIRTKIRDKVTIQGHYGYALTDRPDRAVDHFQDSGLGFSVQFDR